MVWIVVLFPTAASILSSAQTFKTLANFGYNGFGPSAPLVQAFDGNLYGTDAGGCIACGMVFKMAPNGTLTTLHGFLQTGATPTQLIQATNGNFYSTTYGGGANGNGMVFKITTSGTVTLLHSFDYTDGSSPWSGVIQGVDGNFYGTTLDSAANNGAGTIYEITPLGTLTTLYTFCSQTNCSDGEYPLAGLVQATDGNFYGTAEMGGANGYGTVFQITPSGTLTTLYNFCSQPNCNDGQFPSIPLIQATDGNFYGVTAGGGNNGYGTVFQITPSGTLTTLYNFCSQTNCSDGESPSAALIQATDGNFYGTTLRGGTKGFGSIFKITSGGTLTTLYSFCVRTNCADGAYPGGLIQATNGRIYGPTSAGGATRNSLCRQGCGTAFTLGVGLGPFVKTNPTSGKVGSNVIVVGNNLTGAAAVTFNGIPSTSLRVTNSAIRTSVPAGATSGTVVVTTPNGTLSSNVAFEVQ